ncbi:hypothetical protein Terro_0334 [Terriglobus roseus DSM 18391]|uniref:Uncharacterized protein n=1 Tax=Terriglobus roseus (strain DSM 18391 / NRRL B-41598 / KBS 63) TaxID=926566 RepID=I3ZBR5_TERRK|nr:hypothetical protein Terro_0334 [Terriglobus roseus DSM 18391]
MGCLEREQSHIFRIDDRYVVDKMDSASQIVVMMCGIAQPHPWFVGASGYFPRNRSVRPLAPLFCTASR